MEVCFKPDPASELNGGSIHTEVEGNIRAEVAGHEETTTASGLGVYNVKYAYPSLNALINGLTLHKIFIT